MIDAEAPLDRLPYIYPGRIRFCPWGRTKEWSTQKPADPIELRISVEQTETFTLYEDENDGYDYEKGPTRRAIPLHWDDAGQVLTIGERKGEFPGMLKKPGFSRWSFGG